MENDLGMCCEQWISLTRGLILYPKLFAVSVSQEGKWGVMAAGYGMTARSGCLYSGCQCLIKPPEMCVDECMRHPGLQLEFLSDLIQQHCLPSRDLTAKNSHSV